MGKQKKLIKKHKRKPNKRRIRKIIGAGVVGDVAKDIAIEGAKQAGTFALTKLAGAALGGPVGMAIQSAVELGYRAIEKAVKADYTQSKQREFNKAYKPVKDKKTDRYPNWLTGGWYAPKTNPQKNRYAEDYDFGTW